MYKQSERKNSRRVVLTAALLLLTLLLSAAVACSGRKKQETYRTITVVSVTGNATVSNDKKTVAAYENMALYDGDTVTVAEGASLSILLDGDKYMLAEGGTTFSLEATGKKGQEKTVIRLENGSTLTRIKTSLNEDQSFVIETPTSTIAVRGTVYRIDVVRGENGVITVKHDCFEGVIEVTPIDPTGQPTETPERIKAGSSARVVSVPAASGGEKPSSSFVRDESGKVQEDVDFRDLPGKIIKELIDFIEDGEDLFVGKDDLEELLPTPGTDPIEPETDPATETDPVTETDPETDPPHTHVYDGDFAADGENGHRRLCSGCGEAQPALQPHEGNGNATCTQKDTCTLCGVEFGDTAEHTFEGNWTEGHVGHYKSCSACGAHSEEVPHEWDRTLSSGSTRYNCEYCGAVSYEDPALSAGEWKHTFSDEWTFDDDGHWHAAVCGCDDLTSEYSVHLYDMGVEGVDGAGNPAMVYTCCECGHTAYFATVHICEPVADTYESYGNYCWRPCTTEGCLTQYDRSWHSYSTEYDDAEHWLGCYYCHDTVDREAHTPEWMTDSEEHARYCTDCSYWFIEWEAHSYGDGVRGKNPFGEDCTVYTCADCGYIRYDVMCDGNHIYGPGVAYTTGEGTEVTRLTCLYCDQTVDMPLHDCACTWDQYLFNEHYHWSSCQTEGCPARFYYEAHDFRENVIIREPTHGEWGLRAEGCYCGYHLPGTEVAYEFMELYLVFDETCGGADMNIWSTNEFTTADTFDYTAIKIYGIYADSYDENYDLLLNEDGTPVYGRLLREDEYIRKFYHSSDPYDYGTLLRSEPEDHMDIGLHELRIILRDGDGESMEETMRVTVTYRVLDASGEA